MPIPSHQTVRLARGRHLSPHEGACVMELASMLAGEPFGRRPRSVSPTIAAFLRTYNDRLDDDRRQDLYACAAKVVGTRASAGVERARARRCLAWAELCGNRLSRAAAVLLSGCAYAGRRAATAATSAAIDDKLHRATLAFIDELIAVGAERAAPDRPEVEPAPPTTAARDGEETAPR
jgi:hypothetical protein